MKQGELCKLVPICCMLVCAYPINVYLCRDNKQFFYLDYTQVYMMYSRVYVDSYVYVTSVGRVQIYNVDVLIHEDSWSITRQMHLTQVYFWVSGLCVVVCSCEQNSQAIFHDYTGRL